MASALPRLVIFDVNETLSDMGPMADRFAAVGAPPGLAATWFASVLRDGFALTATGQNPSFAEIAAQSLAWHLPAAADDREAAGHGRKAAQDDREAAADDREAAGDSRQTAGDSLEAATRHVMEGFTTLPVHPDVVPGVRSLRDLGLRLVTLTNGATSVAQGLFDRNGISDAFDRLLSVEDAGAWKPAGAAYQYALDVCGVDSGDALLVAVHPWDIHGARRAGLRTCWINRTARRYPGYFDAPEIEATSIVDLADRLRRAGAA